MTKVDFYISKQPRSGNRHMIACRLADKAYKLGHQVYVHANNPQEAKMLDDLLWTFRDGSFIPHALASTSNDDPVVVGFETSADACPATCNDVLINLALEVPCFFSRFDRVAEIVDQDEESRASARTRYRYYQDRGYQLNNHDL